MAPGSEFGFAETEQVSQIARKNIVRFQGIFDIVGPWFFTYQLPLQCPT